MVRYYSGWEDQPYKCPGCAWAGAGSECVREPQSELYELLCPACGAHLGAVSFPTLDEMRENRDRLTEWETQRLEAASAWQQEQLRSPDQLPDLEAEEITLYWDMPGQDTGPLLIRCGEQIIWREPAVYEGYWRFAQIAELLLRKYGGRLRDLIPTRTSELYLYGDRLNAPAEVRAVRDRIANQHRQDGG